MSSIELIATERARQIDSEGWSDAHDDKHPKGELAVAGIAYASVGSAQLRTGSRFAPVTEAASFRFPWANDWWKPTADPLRNLVKSASLIAAEIDKELRNRGHYSDPNPSYAALRTSHEELVDALHRAITEMKFWAKGHADAEIFIAEKALANAAKLAPTK